MEKHSDVHACSNPKSEASHRFEEMLAVLSHDLRGPLGNLALAVSLLSELAPPNSDETAVLQRAKRSLDHATAIIEDFLRIRISDDDASPLALEAVALESVVRTAVRELDAIAQTAGVSLSVAPYETPPPILAHRERLTWALRRLLRHAIRVTPEGGSVCIEVVEGRANEVLCRVSDGGPTLTESDLERLFDRWPSRHQSRRGAGFGPALIRQALEAQQASIHAEAGSKGGVRFVLSFAVASAVGLDSR